MSDAPRLPLPAHDRKGVTLPKAFAGTPAQREFKHILFQILLDGAIRPRRPTS